MMLKYFPLQYSDTRKQVLIDDNENDNENFHSDSPCLICGPNEVCFERETCINDFMTYLCGDGEAKEDSLSFAAKQNRCKILVFAHNLKGYDGHFILLESVDRKYIMTPLMTGNKIMKLQIGNISFYDSLNLFQTSLAALPKIFGFEDACKGFFPHYLNAEENWKIYDDVPAKENFGHNEMSCEKRKDFDAWWESMKGKPYNLYEELHSYCRNDVKILMTAIQEFRRQFKEITRVDEEPDLGLIKKDDDPSSFDQSTGLDPLTRNFTLASVAMEVFRTLFLKSKTIGITPVDGYKDSRNYSFSSLVWLEEMEKIYGAIEREQKVGPYWVDGLIRDRKLIFEYDGCYFHGCNNCYNPDVILAHSKKNSYLMEQTREKLDNLRSFGYEVLVMKECDWKKKPALMRAGSEEVNSKHHRLSNDAKLPLNIRNAFAGGRTNNIVFNVSCKEGETIEYNDVVSLYPHVLVSKKYPIGHPKRILSGFDHSLASYEGFIQCTILPPRNLRIPVLWQRTEGKLIFPLCGTCLKDQKGGLCWHMDHERVLEGTWPIPEVRLAIEKGYVLGHISQILHYEKTANDIFVGYIRKFLKIKQESSGWPSPNMTQAEKDDYVRQFAEKEGVELNVQMIEKNPGRRAIAKLMLNSLWGKLCQGANLDQTKIVHTHEQLLKLITDERFEITGEVDLRDGSTQLTYKYRDDAKAPQSNVSVAIGAYVTAYGRCELYSIIDELEKRSPGCVCYFDTDSVFYKRKSNEPKLLRLGSYLGELTDEIEKDFGPGAKCLKAVFNGPKNYAYQVTCPGEDELKVVMKCKGLSLTHEARQKINFDLMADYAQSYSSSDQVVKEIQVPQFNIRTSRRHDVYSTRGEKVYRVVSEKRWINDGETLPFGYNPWNENDDEFQAGLEQHDRQRQQQ